MNAHQEQRSNQYQILVKGRLDPAWSKWFDGFTITPWQENSLLHGTVVDQAALYGYINKIRDLGLKLLLVQQAGLDIPGYTREVSMTTTEKIRPFNINQDITPMINLVEVAFAGELERWGSNFREQMMMAQKMVPVINLLKRFFDAFQHTFDGFVWEEDGQVVSLVTIGKTGLDKTRWQIGNVATYPDYRRQGLARKLVTRAMQHASAHGAQACILEVRAKAEPAYQLYRSLGFTQYDSITGLKLESLPEIKAIPLDGYQLVSMKFGEWQKRYVLVLKAIPQDVQDFMPINQAEYRISPIERITTPLALRMQGLDVHRWGVIKDGDLVAYLSLAANRKLNSPHDLEFSIDPAHQATLAEPLLALALETLSTYPQRMIRIEVRSANTDMLALLHGYGFEDIEVNHRLGTKV